MSKKIDIDIKDTISSQDNEVSGADSKISNKRNPTRIGKESLDQRPEKREESSICDSYNDFKLKVNNAPSKEEDDDFSEFVDIFSKCMNCTFRTKYYKLPNVSF